MSATVLKELLARVDAADGPDWDLNHAVLAATNPNKDGPYANWQAAASAFGWDVQITASADAAMAHVARVLAGVRVCTTWEPDSYARAELLVGRNHRTRLLGDVERADGFVALAIMAALLKALIAEGQG